MSTWLEAAPLQVRRTVSTPLTLRPSALSVICGGGVGVGVTEGTGCQSGKPSKDDPGEMTVWSLPSAFITAIWNRLFRVVVKVIMLPSGDQAGSASKTGFCERFIRSLPCTHLAELLLRELAIGNYTTVQLSQGAPEDLKQDLQMFTCELSYSMTDGWNLSGIVLTIAQVVEETCVVSVPLLQMT